MLEIGPSVKPPPQFTMMGILESATEHDADAEELEVDDVTVAEMVDEDDAVAELVSLADVELVEELESELEAVELEAVELAATELEDDEGQRGGARMNAACQEVRDSS